MSIGFGSDIAALGAEALEEQFDRDVPCGQCGKPAVLRSDGHGCRSWPAFKCIKCWQVCLETELDKNRMTGRRYFDCARCNQHFPTVESFSDFRPF